MYDGYRFFPGGRGGQDVMLTPQAHLVSRGPEKSRAITLHTLRAFVVYKRGKTYLQNRRIRESQDDPDASKQVAVFMVHKIMLIYTGLFKMIVGVQSSSGNSAPNSG